jgi:hypothetical protein
MKAALLTLALVVHPQAQAEIVTKQKPVECISNPQKLMQGLVTSDYKETPVWFGHEPDTGSNYVLFTNTQTKTWTLVQFDQNTACVLGAGTTSTTTTQ